MGMNENTALEPKMPVKEKIRFFQEKSSGKSQKFRRKAWSPDYIKASRPAWSKSVHRAFLDVQATASGLKTSKKRKGPTLLRTTESIFREDIAQSRRDLLEIVKQSCMGGRTASATNGDGPFRHH